MNDVVMFDGNIFANEDGIAMPTQRVSLNVQRNGPIIRVSFYKKWGQGVLTLAKAMVSLLQNDDIRIDLFKDIEDPYRSADPIGANGLADVVTGDLDCRFSHQITSAIK